MAQFTWTSGYDPKTLADSLKFVRTTITSAVDVTLKAEEKTPVIGVTLSAASKVVTLGLDDGQCAIVINEGDTNAFTLKNVSGDSGSSLASGKALLVVASQTANSTKTYALN